MVLFFLSINFYSRLGGGPPGPLGGDDGGPPGPLVVMTVVLWATWW